MATVKVINNIICIELSIAEFNKANKDFNSTYLITCNICNNKSDSNYYYVPSQDMEVCEDCFNDLDIYSYKGISDYIYYLLTRQIEWYKSKGIEVKYADDFNLYNLMSDKECKEYIEENDADRVLSSLDNGGEL